MGKSMTKSNGNDKIYTPDVYADGIVKHYNPIGIKCEPCYGQGSFFRAMGQDTLWYEIDKGKDFLSPQVLEELKCDWIITNPPYSLFRKFLNQSMRVSNNVVFLQLINAVFFKARLRDIKDNNFGIKEIWCFEEPKNFPKFGFQTGCVWYQRGYKGGINMCFDNINGEVE